MKVEDNKEERINDARIIGMLEKVKWFFDGETPRGKGRLGFLNN